MHQPCGLHTHRSPGAEQRICVSVYTSVPGSGQHLAWINPEDCKPARLGDRSQCLESEKLDLEKGAGYSWEEKVRWGVLMNSVISRRIPNARRCAPGYY